MSITKINFVSFFLYFYIVKTLLTILLFFVSTCALVAHPVKEKNTNLYGDSDVAFVDTKSTHTDVPTTSQIVNSNGNGGFESAKRNELHSILGYSIMIFFSVLIIILVDNHKLEKRYKKLLSDTKTKE